MKTTVLLGLQWGDEGKGKIVDILTPKYDLVARFQGGPNAGHTLLFNHKKHVLCSIPSGIFQAKINIIGNGMVLDPILFQLEIEKLKHFCQDLTDKILISQKTHLILPTHLLLDKAYEKQKGNKKIGTTGKGIGPTYTDKVSRNGLRVGDIDYHFKEKYQSIVYLHKHLLNQMNVDYSELPSLEKKWEKSISVVKQFRRINSEYFFNQALKDGKTILAEGAQGTMLDLDFGSYPFVTSSNTVCASACIGLGIPPARIGDVFGVFKAYCTRVGSGPFPTELLDATGEKLRDIGHEYGSVTGRPRRCGWIDLVSLRYAIMINGVTDLIIMKSDVLSSFDTIKICIAYEINGKITKDFPFEMINSVKPIYSELMGWNCDLTKIKSENEFPNNFKIYLSFLEKHLNMKICIVSVGPDRKQTIFRKSIL